MRTHTTILYQIEGFHIYLTEAEKDELKSREKQKAVPVWQQDPVLLWCNSYADFMCNPINSRMTFTQEERDESVKEIYFSFIQAKILDDFSRIQGIRENLLSFQNVKEAEELLETLDVCVVPYMMGEEKPKRM